MRQKATELAEEQALFHLAAGEALIVDNWRLLHSRQPYQGRRKMWRCLDGVGWGGWKKRRNVLLACRI